MAPLHDAANDGSLTNLDQFRSATPRFDIDEPDSKGRTALAYAAWKGHVRTVKLLVDGGANVNKLNDKQRSALWYASLSDSSVTKQRRLEVVEYLLRFGADPAQKAHDESTALTRLIEHREPTVIKLVTQYCDKMEATQASSSRVENLAKATKDQAVMQALDPRLVTVATRDELVTELVTFILKSIGFMNKTLSGMIRTVFGIKGTRKATLKCAQKTSKSSGSTTADTAPKTNKSEAFANRIFTGEINMSPSLGEPDLIDTLAVGKDEEEEEEGDDDDVPPVVPVSEISDLTTPEEFQASMTKYIDETGLSDFFPEGNDFLQIVAGKAAELKKDPNNKLKKSEDVENCTKLALYQPVFFCGDQIELVRRVSRISTCLVPDGCGTGLQFINDRRGLDKNLTAEQVGDIMTTVKPRGNTKIGTHLEQKILKPLVYDVIKEGKKLTRPILVSCITDGCATGEPSDKFKEAILNCVQFLRENGYPQTAIRFQISQIGNDAGAESFLRELRDDPLLKNILFCTTHVMSAFSGCPSTSFTSFKNLFSAVDNSTSDILVVTNVSPKVFEEIYSARDAAGRKFRLSLYTAKSRMLIVKFPTGFQETAHRHLDLSTASKMDRMGLLESWALLGGTTYREISNEMLISSGEGDSVCRPRSARPSKRGWPTLVIECGYSQTVSSLRAKAHWWFQTSNFDVKIVLLLKLNETSESILIEKWKTPQPPVRRGATMTRIAAVMQPQCVHTISIARNPDRFSNNRYSVYSGPLRLEFKDLFLREPTSGSAEGDVVIGDGELQLIAFMTWEPEAEVLT
ncbi:hypothetical protein V8C37DRAFT_408783 [Trichoderma ceciliae]